jgi:hypothetical protein
MQMKIGKSGTQFLYSVSMTRTTKRKKSERRQIDIHSESEIEYWSKKLGCSHERLINAVKKAGTSPIKVARELEK